MASVIVLGAAQAGRADEVFVSITPCRVVNTRDVPADGPKLGNQVTRDFTIQGNCGVPVGAKAVAINVTVTEQEAQGFLSVFPSDLDFGVTAFHSNLNFPAVEFATDNGSIAPLAAVTPDLSVYWDSLPSTAPSTFATHVLIDVFGYFTEFDAGPIAKDPASIYEVTSTTTSVDSIGGSCTAFPCNTGTATASCLDNNDVGISGHCDMNPNTNSVILDQEMANVDTTSAAASFTCRWRNDDTNPNNGKAVIVCLVVP
jgi:hypothetical protein